MPTYVISGKNIFEVHKMKKCIYKIISPVISALFFSTVAISSDIAEDPNRPSQSTLQKMEEHGKLIHECLEPVEKAELHLYWTTGYTLSDNLDYMPDTQVNVGGLKYAQKIFPLLHKLLDISPKHLEVKFVLDPMTFQFNAPQINEIHASHGERFKVVMIDDVWAKLKKHFNDPLNMQSIDRVFQNGTRGKSVLTSDIYRVIGPLFGYDLPSDVFKTLFTYVDVDAFCGGMASSGDYLNQMITALFYPVTKEAAAPDFRFYFGRNINNSDLIKIRVKDVEAYSQFCKQVLDKLYLSKPVFNYFTTLHNKIRQYEGDSSLSINGDDLIYPVATRDESFVRTVMNATGPEFLCFKGITYDLEYPKELAGEWYAPQERLNYHMTRNSSCKPSNGLTWPSLNVTSEEEAAAMAFDQDCDAYREKFLTAACYAKRFGSKHPFNMLLRQALVDFYPYQAPSFKNLLEKNFESYNKDKKVGYSFTIVTPDDTVGFFKERCFSVNGTLLKQNEKEDNTFDCIMKISDTDFWEGPVIIDLGKKLEPMDVYTYRDEICRCVSKAAGRPLMEKGLSYEEWEAMTRASMGESKYYHRLTDLLNMLDIYDLYIRTLDFRQR